MISRRSSCKRAELSTGYPQDEIERLAFDEGIEYLGDPMDVPDPFEGLEYGSQWSVVEEKAPGAPRRRDRPVEVASGRPRIKDRTVELPTSPEMYAALRVAERRGDIVTSGSEGRPSDKVHAARSQHYTGTALDLRFAPDRVAQVAAYRAEGYVVVIEKTHLHVQRWPVTA